MSSNMKPKVEKARPADEPARMQPVDEDQLRTPGSELMIRRMSDPVPIKRETRLQHQIIDYNSQHSKVVQSFRKMRTLLLQQAGAANFVTLVTGIRKGSGASFVARNLAASLAFDESRTALLVDCNRDNPSVDSLLDGRARNGLTDVLDNPSEVGIGDVIYSTGIPRLRAIPVGRRRDRPAEYFTTQRMRTFLDVVRRRYPDRYVLVDAPSMEESADPRILADWCQYVILVVRYGEVTQDELLEAVATFPREKFVGVVFNDFDVPGDYSAGNGRGTA